MMHSMRGRGLSLAVLAVLLIAVGVSIAIEIGPSAPPSISLERARALAQDGQIGGAHFNETDRTLDVSGKAGKFRVTPYPADKTAVEEEFGRLHMSVGGESGGSRFRLGPFRGSGDFPMPVRVLFRVLFLPMYFSIFAPMIGLGIAVAATVDLKRLTELAGRTIGAIEVVWILLFFSLPFWAGLAWLAVGRRARLTAPSPAAQN